MYISSNMIRVHNIFGIKKTFDIFAEAGFSGMDFNNDVAEYCSDAHGKEFYLDLKKYAGERGITVCQAHAPFPSSYPDAAENSKRFDEIVRAMENAAYLGAPMIVVHPCTHLKYDEGDNADILFEYNLNFYRNLIPHARRIGIKIAIENIGRTSVTSSPERLNKLYDTLNDPVFTVCFDVGHCLLEGVDPATAIREIGDRLVNGCTHVHDNCGDADSHTLPYFGKVDWESVMKALADIGYKGNLNYEASGFFKDVPAPLRPDSLKFMAEVGRYLVSRFEYYKSQCESNRH